MKPLGLSPHNKSKLSDSGRALALLVMVCIWMGTATHSQALTFEQPGSGDGTISMDGAHFDTLAPSHDGYSWQTVDTTEAVDNSALQAPLNAQPISTISSNARVDYSINFTQTGSYRLWMRGFSADGNSDTVYVGLDGTPLSSDSFRISPYQTWTWTDRTKNGKYFNITINNPGVYNLNLWMRETGLIVDRIVLIKNAAYAPAGEGPTETPYDGAGQEPDTVATPSISPNGGTFQGSVDVSISTTTAGASIYYTLDGSSPGTGSIAYNAPFALTNSTLVRAIAVKTDYLDSEQISAQFTATTNQAPTLSPLNNQTVSVGDTVGFIAQASDSDSGTPALTANGLPDGASFVDLGNGSAEFDWTPNASDLGSHIITVIATDAADASITSQTQVTITVQEASDPGTGGNDGAIFTEAGGLVAMEGEHFSTLTPSLDGYSWQVIANTQAIANSALQAPLNAAQQASFTDQAKVDYSINFTQTGTYRLWMRGFSQDGNSDTVYVGLNGTPLSSSAFRIAPYQSWLWANKLMNGKYVDISISSPGVHTLNLWMRETGYIVDRLVLSRNAALTPSGDGPVESSRSGGSDQDTVETPTISPNGGSFQDSVEVSLNSSTAAASIHYTLDGSQPNSNSPEYTAPFNLTQSAQVRAIAVRDGYLDSSLASAQFTITTANLAPTLSAITDQTVTAGDTINFEILASDSDSAAPSLSVNNLPSGASFIDMGSGVGEFEWITSNASIGQHLITFIATDADDNTLTTQQQITITVEAAGSDPGGSSGSVYNEAAGLVAMEAEHYSALISSVDGYQWQVISNTGAIGDSALQAPLNAQYQSTFTNNARVDYKINFSQTGVYHLWIRGYSADGNSDTLFAGLDGSPLSSTALRIAPYQTWLWTDKLMDGKYFNITINSTGVHTLNLWMRETGLIVDRIVLSKDSALIPSGNGPEESTRSGDTNPDPDPEPDPEAISGFTHYWQFNENSGNKFYNRIGGSADCSNCPAKEAGPFEQALNFNGANDILVSAYDSRLGWAANKSVTIEAWIKHSSSCQTAEAVIGRNDTSSGMRWWLGCNDGKAAFYMVDANGNNGGMLSGISTIDDNQWHHIAVVKDGWDLQNRLFVDGQLEASQSASYSSTFVGNSSSLSIGGLLGTASNFFFSGQIDEVAIHDRALPEKTLSQHFADGNYGLHRGLVGCDTELKIMPLGDSNTRGNGSIPRYSYRPYLYSDLDVAGYNVNFVGSLTETYGVGFPYDHNHEGHSGFTPLQIANNVINWLSSNSAEIVLLHIGTNEHNVPDVETILDYIDLVDEDIIVVLAKIINEQTYNPATTEFNNQLEAMALARTNDKILLVDQESALNYVDDMSDNLHANNSGYVKMADVWYERLSEFLPVCQPVIPQIASASTHTIELGETLVLAMDHVGFPQPSFSLVSGPAGMKINPDTGVVSWTPSATGSYAVTVKATNDQGQNSIGFTVEVE